MNERRNVLRANIAGTKDQIRNKNKRNRQGIMCCAVTSQIGAAEIGERNKTMRATVYGLQDLWYDNTNTGARSM